MKNNTLFNVAVFVFFLAVYVIFSNQRITTSMDVDVLRYASEYVETGNYGSEYKIASGVAYSPKTGMFYPQEGIGIVVPLSVFVYLSNIINPESQFVIFTFNQFFSALAVLFVFLILSMFMPKKKAFFYTALFGLGTPLFVHSKYLLPEPVTLFSIISALYFMLKFRRTGKPVLVFLSGLSAGYSLLTRPDAPIFAGIFFILAVYVSFRTDKIRLMKNSLFLIAGYSIFTFVFFVSNYQRYGSVLETGYTLDRKTVISSLERDIPLIYDKAVKAYQADQSSEETALYVNKYQSMQKFLEDQNKIIKDIGDKNTNFYSSGPANFFYGLYLIFISPNRSILFISPFLIMLIIGIPLILKKYKIEFILVSTIFSGYLILYALRAPLSYAGSGAWGIRYMLPVYPLIFLSVIFFDRSELFRNKAVKYTFYALCVISFIFQIIGSSVNYQSVQMPLEYKCKKTYGETDMTWAHESRKSMMTDFSSSLLLNNARILTGSLTDEQREYGVETGPNDWFFWQVIKGEGQLVKGKERSMGNFKVLLFLLIISAGVSLYYILKKDIMRPIQK
jgi:hypothetical protein